MKAPTFGIVPAFFLSCPESCSAFTVPNRFYGFRSVRRAATPSAAAALRMNFLSDMGDMLTGGPLSPQESLPYSPALSPTHSATHAGTRTLAVKERALSFTGEDFDVFDAETGSPFARVRGAMLHLPGKDKMRIRAVGGGGEEDEAAVLDRKIVAVTSTYDIYRGGMGAEKVGWIEKKVVALTDTFDVFVEGGGGVGPFKPPPAYRIAGDFLERSWTMKNDRGETVAKASKDGLIQFDAFNHYQVQVAKGMDAILVLACTCAIDEEFDEEHKERKKEAEAKKEGGGWF